MKELNLFLSKSKEVCYIPEAEDSEYTWFDFVHIAKGNEELARIIFDLCDWQHPETVFEELFMEGEIDGEGNIIKQD